MARKIKKYKDNPKNGKVYVVKNGRRKEVKPKKKKKKLNKTYLTYIRSKKWKDKRLSFILLMKAAKSYCCDICGSISGLDVHHLTYERFMDEDLYDLQLLCRKCHKKVHAK
jgi:5-methylcytosine-specific restriction endonuclease McrA